MALIPVTLLSEVPNTVLNHAVVDLVRELVEGELVEGEYDEALIDYLDALVRELTRRDAAGTWTPG